MTLGITTLFHDAVCHIFICPYDECRYAECRGAMFSNEHSVSRLMESYHLRAVYTERSNRLCCDFIRIFYLFVLTFIATATLGTS
jgi:hypothetical protein